jgi:hypothetical protein
VKESNKDPQMIASDNDSQSRQTVITHRDELHAPIEGTVLTAKEQQDIEERWRLQGIALADQIYDLSENQRVTDLDPYVLTINSLVLPLPSKQNQAILDSMRSYFSEKLGPLLIEKGRSPLVEDEIIHRTGRDNRSLIEFILDGYDVQQSIWEIWYADVERSKASLARGSEAEDTFRNALSKVLYPLTNEQLREFRFEYNRIPSILVARALHNALYRVDVEGRSYPDLETVRYTLVGRTSNQIKQIEYHYKCEFHYETSGKNFPPLREGISSLFVGDVLEDLLHLMDGFRAIDSARQIRAMLANCVEEEEDLNPITQLHPDFSGRFRRDYATYPLWERELRCRNAIDRETFSLSLSQFHEVCSILKERYNISLTPLLYRANFAYNPRQIALNLYKAFFNVDARVDRKKDDEYLSDEQLYKVRDEFRLSSSKELSSIIRTHAQEIKAQDSYSRVSLALSPLNHLNSSQIISVRQQFFAIVGMPLDEFVESSVREICRGEIPHYVDTLVQQRLSGILRHDLSADIFDFFYTQNQRLAANKESARLIRAQRRAKDYCQQLEQAIRESNRSGEYESLLDFLREKSHQELLEMEKFYLGNETKSVPLIRQLEQSVPSDIFVDVECLFAGFNTMHLAHKIKEDLKYLSALVNASSDVVLCTLGHYTELHGEDLVENVHMSYSEKRFAPIRALALSLLYTPDACSLKSILSETSPLTQEHLDEFIQHLAKSRLGLLSLETSYNRHFARFETCLEKHFGTLLHRLRLLGTKKILPRTYFSEAVLLLEGLQPSITAELNECLKDANPSQSSLSRIQSILEANKLDLKTIQQSYNALDPNHTLRESIQSLAIPLNIKNKTLLFLDGYNPDTVAEELFELVGKERGEILGEKVLQLLASPSEDPNNDRIPSNTNWITEMYHHIRVSYEEHYGKKLLTELLKANVPKKGKGINAIAFKLYGEIAMKVIDLQRSLDLHLQSDSEKQQELELEVTVILKKLPPALRERLLDMHQAYFGWGSSATLKDLIEVRFKDRELKELAISLLDEAAR